MSNYHNLDVRFPLNQYTGCEHATPVAEILGDLLAEDPDGYNLGALDSEARQLLEIAADRCGDTPPSE